MKIVFLEEVVSVDDDVYGYQEKRWCSWQ